MPAGDTPIYTQEPHTPHRAAICANLQTEKADMPYSHRTGEVINLGANAGGSRSKQSDGRDGAEWGGGVTCQESLYYHLQRQHQALSDGPEVAAPLCLSFPFGPLAVRQGDGLDLLTTGSLDIQGFLCCLLPELLLTPLLQPVQG